MDQFSTDFAMERNIRMIRSCDDPEMLKRVALMLLQSNAALKSLLADSMLKEVSSFGRMNTNRSQ